jgi:DNA-binding NarL/FixJ family response regulator
VAAGEQPGTDLYRELVERELRLHETMQQLLDQEGQVKGNPVPSAVPRTVPLSSRELDIIRLVAVGATNQQIGRELGLSPGTVRNYNGRIFRKLGVTRRTEAAVRAIELGILSRPGREDPPSMSNGSPDARPPSN